VPSREQKCCSTRRRNPLLRTCVLKVKPFAAPSLLSRLEDEAQCLLVIIGSTPEGKKELVGPDRWGARERAILEGAAPRPEAARTCGSARARSLPAKKFLFLSRELPGRGAGLELARSRVSWRLCSVQKTPPPPGGLRLAARGGPRAPAPQLQIFPAGGPCSSGRVRQRADCARARLLRQVFKKQDRPGAEIGTRTTARSVRRQ
jgi:hypothetical protein